MSKGDVVLLVDSKKKRSDWSLSLVKKVFLGRDNKIRVVEVKVGNAVFVRSVHCLIPLELSSCKITPALPVPFPNLTPLFWSFGSINA